MTYISWVTYIPWLSDFALYLEDYLMYKHDTLADESVWLYALPQNKSGSLWPILHGSVILPYNLKAIWWINMIPWANESVWLDAWPLSNSWSLWPIFHGSVTLPYILKTFWWINMIPWANESVYWMLDLKLKVGHCDLYSWFSDFALYFESYSMNKHDTLE